MRSATFFFAWLFSNLIGFIAGSYLGATSGGILPGLIPGIAGILLGDLVFGLSIGLFQWLALKFSYRAFIISPWWVLLTSLGFTFGARAGSLLTYRIINDWLTPSTVFGIFMGGSIGLATYLSYRQSHGWKMLAGWLFVSMLAWVLGEGIAFNSNFSQSTVPHVALTIGGVTGLGLAAFGRFRAGKDSSQTGSALPENEAVIGTSQHTNP